MNEQINESLKASQIQQFPLNSNHQELDIWENLDSSMASASSAFQEFLSPSFFSSFLIYWRFYHHCLIIQVQILPKFSCISFSTLHQISSWNPPFKYFTGFLMRIMIKILNKLIKVLQNLASPFLPTSCTASLYLALQIAFIMALIQFLTVLTFPLPRTFECLSAKNPFPKFFFFFIIVQ